MTFAEYKWCMDCRHKHVSLSEEPCKDCLFNADKPGWEAIDGQKRSREHAREVLDDVFMSVDVRRDNCGEEV